MTAEVPGERRRTTVSLSLPIASSQPVDQLSRTVEILSRVNRQLASTVVIHREELVALGGLLTQISDVLMKLTDLLSASAHHYDRTQLRHVHTDATPAKRPPTAARLLRECRDGYVAAYTSAQALHADLRRGPRTRPRGNGRTTSSRDTL